MAGFIADADVAEAAEVETENIKGMLESETFYSAANAGGMEGFVCKKPGFAYICRGFEEDGAGPATIGSDLFPSARNGR